MGRKKCITVVIFLKLLSPLSIHWSSWKPSLLPDLSHAAQFRSSCSCREALGAAAWSCWLQLGSTGNIRERFFPYSEMFLPPFRLQRCAFRWPHVILRMWFLAQQGTLKIIPSAALGVCSHTLGAHSVITSSRELTFLCAQKWSEGNCHLQGWLGMDISWSPQHFWSS